MCGWLSAVFLFSFHFILVEYAAGKKETFSVFAIGFYPKHLFENKTLRNQHMFEAVDPSVLELPIYKALAKLYDNYNNVGLNN